VTPDARRLEELSLNSSAPPGQLLYDGWLLRMAPGKAKRPRSVNAFYASTLALEDKVRYCERLYGAARLPTLFRITPFAHPADLDAELGRLGYGRFETTSVQSTSISAGGIDRAPDASVMNLRAWVDAVGDLRGTPPEHRATHLARLEGMPLPVRGVAVERDGRVIATGLTIVEDDCAGLFDIATHEQARRQGHARTVVASLLRAARSMGARHAYLQVSAGNAPAIALYREFGFRERYTYWYRGREGEQQ
jgi:ribosomal protein S18 acetylase RimI-like enzyme